MSNRLYFSLVNASKRTLPLVLKRNSATILHELPVAEKVNYFQRLSAIPLEDKAAFLRVTKEANFRNNKHELEVYHLLTKFHCQHWQTAPVSEIRDAYVNMIKLDLSSGGNTFGNNEWNQLYHRLLHVLTLKGDVNLLGVVYEDSQKRQGVEISKELKHKVANAFYAADAMFDVIEMYQAEREATRLKTEQDFTFYLDKFASKGNVLLTEEGIRDMMRAGIQQTADGHATLLKVYAMAGNKSKFEDCLEEYKNKGYKFNNYVYTAYIHYANRIYDYSLMMSVFKECQEKTVELTKIVLNYLMEAEKNEEAWGICQSTCENENMARDKEFVLIYLKLSRTHKDEKSFESFYNSLDENLRKDQDVFEQRLEFLAEFEKYKEAILAYEDFLKNYKTIENQKRTAMIMKQSVIDKLSPESDDYNLAHKLYLRAHLFQNNFIYFK
ncbi:hypothetical protein O9G_004572 [Rozella allomycis CSF55]|uniref:Uncharacterized protein n=1 Tax=Rozella allomycis (strain CSF55) TaxID=988480 RepID=A0A075B1Y0_ROZAC|nr:hypothetical protein O9G_004572 [Rozella allomycis CSF55]|eukprot:EPZ34976.1 hypothetical protein O9G_004572 [Rozella allomycis CSF55]